MDVRLSFKVLAIAIINYKPATSAFWSYRNGHFQLGDIFCFSPRAVANPTCMQPPKAYCVDSRLKITCLQAAITAFLCGGRGGGFSTVVVPRNPRKYRVQMQANYCVA